MLYIETVLGESFSGHVNDAQRIREIGRRNEIALLQADEHELELIIRAFQNVPLCNNRVQLWYGDIARFICANWPV